MAFQNHILSNLVSQEHLPPHRPAVLAHLTAHPCVKYVHVQLYVSYHTFPFAFTTLSQCTSIDTLSPEPSAFSLLHKAFLGHGTLEPSFLHLISWPFAITHVFSLCHSL